MMTKETKFTPGPWVLGTSADNGINAVKGIDPMDDRRFEICEVWGENDDKFVTAMSTANANLIAAAPDLYAALEAAMGYIDVAVGDPDVNQTVLDAWNRLQNMQPERVLSAARGDQ